MNPHPSPPEIQRALESAVQQRQAQQQVTAALQQILVSPHTTVRIDHALLALQHDPAGTIVLSAATIDGRRHDIPLTPALIAAIVGEHTKQLVADAKKPAGGEAAPES